MTIAISFDPTDATDVEYITTLLGSPAADETPAPAKKTRAAAKPAPEPVEEEPAEEATGVTQEQAIEKAQELVAEGRTAEVKGALAEFGVKRVTELDDSQLEDFVAKLSEESVV